MHSMKRGSCPYGNGLQLYPNEGLEEEKKNASEMSLKKIYVVDISKWPHQCQGKGSPF